MMAWFASLADAGQLLVVIGVAAVILIVTWKAQRILFWNLMITYAIWFAVSVAIVGVFVYLIWDRLEL